MADDFDDILGSTETAPEEQDFFEPLLPKRRIGRPSKKEIDERTQLLADIANVDNGAPIEWFVKHFKMSRATINDKLKTCPVHRRHPTKGHPYYDIKTAAGYLVEQQIDTERLLRTIKAGDLPLKLQEQFWNAKIKEMKFKVLAGELWPTESVMEVLSDTFGLIAGKMKLWVDDLEEVNQLTDEMRAGLIKLVDSLRDEIRNGLIAKVEVSVTESYVEGME
jgi:hypothetical protein